MDGKTMPSDLASRAQAAHAAGGGLAAIAHVEPFGRLAVRAGCHDMAPGRLDGKTMLSDLASRAWLATPVQPNLYLLTRVILFIYLDIRVHLTVWFMANKQASNHK